ncbi:hypothetical protein TREMEDRAFT_25247, partial [Tremella mesenterica DSM 1558]|uniref:uncharacterized protein n=1 Tax=Tremella mesenterica (strain ATCC 24925 / CBS 8224 / DSM 1558 / NBRC 9311 / NRRL Y-6157 / RJB 2259-6 / UBC 559-6) TaxID=578456 RepID=UPI0003F49623
DINCPFSYLGVLHLLSAIEKYHTSQPNANFEPIIRLLPYNLDENLTERPLPRAEYRQQRLGLERAALAEKNFMEKFAAIGVDANSGGLISSPHLFNRILTHALFIAPETQLPIALQLFHAIHVDARHPSDRALIADAAVEHGLFPTITKAMLWMERDECDAQVRRAYVTARRLGVTGVPFYVFEDRWALSGLHGVEEFVSVSDKACFYFRTSQFRSSLLFPCVSDTQFTP